MFPGGGKFWYLFEALKETLKTVWLLVPWGRGMLISACNPIRNPNVREAKSSPRSVGSRLVFFLGGKIYIRALVLPWFPKSQKQHVFWKNLGFSKHSRKFGIGKRVWSYQVIKSQVQVAASCFWDLWAEDQDWQVIQTSQCKATTTNKNTQLTTNN